MTPAPEPLTAHEKPRAAGRAYPNAGAVAGRALKSSPQRICGGRISYHEAEARADPALLGCPTPHLSDNIASFPACLTA
jgi:hypothetical protein